MLLRLRFWLSKKDIRDGLAGACSQCPLALSLRRVFPGAEVRVGRYRATVYCPGQPSVTLGDRARDVVRLVDSGQWHKVSPTYLTAYIPRELVKHVRSGVVVPRTRR